MSPKSAGPADLQIRANVVLLHRHMGNGAAVSLSQTLFHPTPSSCVSKPRRRQVETWTRTGAKTLVQVLCMQTQDGWSTFHVSAVGRAKKGFLLFVLSLSFFNHTSKCLHFYDSQTMSTTKHNMIQLRLQPMTGLINLAKLRMTSVPKVFHELPEQSASFQSNEGEMAKRQKKRPI